MRIKYTEWWSETARRQFENEAMMLEETRTRSTRILFERSCYRVQPNTTAADEESNAGAPCTAKSPETARETAPGLSAFCDEEKRSFARRDRNGR